jgi:hypothetical protein
MKITSIAVAAVLSAVSLSALAKDTDRVGVVDNAFTYMAAGGEQSVVVGSTIEGAFSSQTAIALGGSHSAVTGTGGRAITGTGRAITGTGRAITGTGRAITGTGRAITGTGRAITGTGRAITGTGRAITGTGGR